MYKKESIKNHLLLIELKCSVQEIAMKQSMLLNNPLREFIKLHFPFAMGVYRYFKKQKYILSGTPTIEKYLESEFTLAQDKSNSGNGWMIQKNSYDLQNNSSQIINENSTNEKLLIVHAYYENESENIFKLIKDFVDYDIVITTPKKNIYDQIVKCGLKNWIPLLVPNYGRDVIPFLLTLKVLDINKYTHFVKIHSKRSGHLGVAGARWYCQNIYTLVGNKFVTNDICDLMNPNTACLTGVDVIGLDDHYENNKEWLSYLTNDNYTKSIYTKGFIPGTMFIGNLKALQLIKVKKLHLFKHEEEKGQLDGCLGHALERYFGYTIMTEGGNVLPIKELVLNYNDKD